MMSDQSAGKDEIPIPAWAHRAGMLSLGEATQPSDPAAVADRLLIIERITRYCWGFDERQIDKLAACFTDDAVWEGNVLGKISIGPFKGRDAIMNFLADFWPHQHDQRRHLALNHLIEEQTAETATSWSYLLLMGSKGEKVSLETSGFYKVRYRKEEGQWKIENLTAGFDAPFWPVKTEKLSAAGRARHGILD